MDVGAPGEAGGGDVVLRRGGGVGQLPLLGGPAFRPLFRPACLSIHGAASLTSRGHAGLGSGPGSCSEGATAPAGPRPTSFLACQTTARSCSQVLLKASRNDALLQ